MAAITICSDFGAPPKKIKSDTVSTVSSSISHEVIGPNSKVELHLNQSRSFLGLGHMGSLKMSELQKQIKIPFERKGKWLLNLQ